MPDEQVPATPAPEAPTAPFSLIGDTSKIATAPMVPASETPGPTPTPETPATPVVPVAPRADAPIAAPVSPATHVAPTPAPATGTVRGEVTPPADPRAYINDMAAKYGYNAEDVASFPDVASAEAAIGMWADNLAKGGLQGFNQQPQQAAPNEQPQYPNQPYTTGLAQQPQEIAPLNFKELGLEEDDPAAKAIRAMEQRFAVSEKGRVVNTQVLLAMDRDNRAANKVALADQADTIVSQFESPVYGVTGNRAATQELAVGRLHSFANALLIGAHNQNPHLAVNQLPSLQTRLNQAALIDSQSTSPTLAPPIPQVPAPPLPGEPGVLRESQIVSNEGAKEMSLTDVWSENPQLMNMLSGR